MNQFDDDIISGSIWKSVWKVAWPVVFTQVIAGVGGAVDQILVGRYVGYEAQAAVGAASMGFVVTLVFLSSFFHGMNIHIARYSGKRETNKIDRVFFETLKVSLFAFVFGVAPLGYFVAPYYIAWVAPDEAVQAHALPYLRLLFTTSLPMFLMFFMNGAFQSVGNPKIPMYFGILTMCIKILASFVLVSGIGPFPALGVLGAAAGSCIGPIPSVLIALFLISRRKAIIGFPAKMRLKPDMKVIWPVLRLGVPVGLQSVLLNIGGIILIHFIGRLPMGAEAQTAYFICYGQLFSFVTWAGFGLRAACATVMGQNIGAGKTERGTHSVYVGTFMGFLWASFFGTLYWFLSSPLLALFSLEVDGGNEQIVIEYATELLQFLTFSGMFVIMSLAFTGGLQGAGDTKKPMYIAFVSQIIVLLGVCAGFELIGELTTTKIWTAILVSHVSRLCMSYAVFARGNWRGIKVEIAD
jgi:putative MATE family efflux protein